MSLKKYGELDRDESNMSLKKYGELDRDESNMSLKNSGDPVESLSHFP
jgi:hypothetical protein